LFAGYSSASSASNRISTVGQKPGDFLPAFIFPLAPHQQKMIE